MVDHCTSFGTDDLINSGGGDLDGPEVGADFDDEVEVEPLFGHPGVHTED